MSRRVRDPEAKRSALVAAALEAFSADGFAAVSTGTVARHAGVSEGMVFHHFGSKHGLLEAVTADEVTTFVEGQLLIDGGPIEWERFIDATFVWMAGHDMVIRLWRDQDDRVVGSLRRGMQRGVVPTLAGALEAGQDHGWYRVGDPTWLASAAFAVVGEALIAPLGRGRPDATEVGRIVRGIVEPG